MILDGGPIGGAGTIRISPTPAKRVSRGSSPLAVFASCRSQTHRWINALTILARMAPSDRAHPSGSHWLIWRCQCDGHNPGRM
jgi:hypothetical protein